MPWPDLTPAAAYPRITDAELAALCGPVDHGRYCCVACGAEFDRRDPRLVGLLGDYCCLACLLGDAPALGDEDVRKVPDAPD